MKNNSTHLLLLLVAACFLSSSVSSTAVTTSDNTSNHDDHHHQQLTREEFRQLLAQHDDHSLNNQRPHSRQLQEEKYDSPDLKDITAKLNSYIKDNHGGDVDKAFNSFDVNDDGTLGRVEAIYVASKIGNYESNIDVSDKILDQYSTRNSMERSLDLTEFRAAAKGDPHFTTLMGRRFSYHGACDLNLIQHPNFNLRFQKKNTTSVTSELASSSATPLGMDLHVRTEHMLQQQYSFISNIALKIGSSVLEITADGRDWVDGHSNRNFPLFFSEGQFPINKTVIGETCWGVGIEHQSKRCGPHILYDVILGGPTNDHIMVKVTKQMIHLDIKTSLDTMKGSRGLLGTLKEEEVAQKQANSSYPLVEILSRDGTSIVRDFENYARHWQVVPSKDGPLLFQGAREPQFPNRCIEPVVLTPSEELRAQPQRRLRSNVEQSLRRRRNLENLRDAAQKACYNVKPMEDVEFCIQDILATGDLSMAEAVYGA